MVVIRRLGMQPYHSVWLEMKQFTLERTAATADEIWFVEHPMVYTQGQAGKPEHVLDAQDIPVVQSDRGGQVTYHGPGQLIAYVLFDLRRRHLNVRGLVNQLEQVLITFLRDCNLTGVRQCGLPGVYVDQKKIASLGLRIKNGCSYHGIALNVSMNLTPFLRINPCGQAQLQMTQLEAYIPNVRISDVQEQLIALFLTQFGS